MQMNFGIADNVRNLMDALMLCSAVRKLYIQKPDKSRYRRLWGYTEKKCPGYFGRGKRSRVTGFRWNKQPLYMGVCT